ncbi:TetR family transcriptional regulator [Paenibacillus chungangensis]|uniref:TetR family transcriptional regulator n=1 Tax=Paenibacillus chungangensis TaxID=696535 RepID=A0ABW3HU99_9BACL
MIKEDYGLPRLLLRNIARESGLSLGALYHYFSTQYDLIDFFMRLVKERVTSRINELISIDMPLFQKVLKILL